jgi:hypothetical protein
MRSWVRRWGDRDQRVAWIEAAAEHQPPDVGDWRRRHQHRARTDAWLPIILPSWGSGTYAEGYAGPGIHRSGEPESLSRALHRLRKARTHASGAAWKQTVNGWRTLPAEERMT